MTLCLGDKLTTLVVTEDGNMSVFGNNGMGQLGLGHQDYIENPTLLDKLAFDSVDVVMASAGIDHSACITSTGSLWIWGRGFCGALGIAPGDNSAVPQPRLVPTQVFAQFPVLMVACGQEFTLILTRANEIWSCGDNVSGQLGHNDTETRYLFTQIDRQLFGPGATVRMIAAGSMHSMAFTHTGDDNTLWTWGRNRNGQLGHGDKGAERPVPVAIPAATFNGQPVVFMDGGHGHTLVVTADGSLWGCGADSYGELGLHTDSGSDDDTDVLTMQKVVGPEFADGQGVLMAACGYFHSVVLAKNHTVWVCGFGRNISGINTDANCTRLLTPIDPALFGNQKILTVAAGYYDSGVVTEHGNVWSWSAMASVGPHRRNLHTRAGRWHCPPLDHALAFAMISHDKLGAGASCYGQMFPPELMMHMFDDMYFQPHAATPDGVRDMLGRPIPRRMIALHHDAAVVQDDLDTSAFFDS